LSAASWAVLILASVSAGVYCGVLCALASGRWIAGRIPFSGLLAATALFAFARLFATATPLGILASLFALVAIVQIASARSADVSLRLLTLVPLAAMLIISAGQIAGAISPAVFQNALAGTLCAPAPIALALSLRNFNLVRKAAFDRVR